MENPKILSGYMIVAKGVTKLDASLPELGLKDVIPNGSWLEQKQIQSALEARKQLIEVERIEKFGSLSHAIWRDDLKLAEVTQKTGGYWQYLGHNVGKTLYLRPEEVLYLMEVNSLLLKHNDLVVSIQKAYSLLLKEISITQYRVYASLSRLGYKILRHKGPTNIKNESSPPKQADLTNKPSNLDGQHNIDKTIDNHETNDNCLLCPENKFMTATQSAMEPYSKKPTKENKKESEETNADYLNNKQNTDVIIVKVKDAKEVTNAEDNMDNSMVVLQNEVLECNKDCREVDNIKEDDGEKERTDSLHVVTNAASGVNEAADDEVDSIIANSDTQEAKNVQYVEIQKANNPNPPDVEVNNVPLEVNMDLDSPNNQNVRNSNSEINNTSKIDNKTSDDHAFRGPQTFLNYVGRLKELTSKHTKPCDYKVIAKIFENIPDLFKKEIVTINVPDEKYIPKNVFVNNTSYVLNINQIKSKRVRSSSVESSVYNNVEEVNANHIRRIRSNSNNEFNQNIHFANDVRFAPRHTLYFRPFNFWRPHNNPNYAPYNMYFQRPSFPNVFFHSRFQNQYRPYPFLRMYTIPNNFHTNSGQYNTNNVRKRIRSTKANHLHSIKNVAFKLKQLIMSGNTHSQNIQSLNRLVLAFNNRYKTRLRLNKDFEIVNDDSAVETIEIDEDDEPKSKKSRQDQDSGKFDENFGKLRQLALKLKDLEGKNKASPKHKRALSKAVKTFNKSYDADIYMNKDYEIIDKRFINLDSDSEPECIITETNGNVKKKRLKNPFYMLKKRSEKQTEAVPSTSKEYIVEELNASNVESATNNKYCAIISNTFNEGWLPDENDFGRAEVVKKNLTNSSFVDAFKDECLYSFLKEHDGVINNWLEAKLAFFQHIEDTEAILEREQDAILNTIKEPVDYSGVKPLVNSECSNTESVLEKLRIIKNNNTIIDVESDICVHFDLYNRDVQNFRKTNLPKPHFRIVCIEESTNFPSAADVMALHSKYDDNVAIVFAISGTSSISYLQIKPLELPVYIGSNDME